MNLTTDPLPLVLPAWSGVFSSKSPTADRVVFRRWNLPGGQHLRIQEESGESIARHIWDAGLVLAVYLNECIDTTNDLSTVINQAIITSTNRSLNVIELGCGSGLVGITFAQAVPRCQVILTDRTEAQELVEWNLSRMMPADQSSARFHVLNWEDEVPSGLNEKDFDLVLVSDCTYNPSSAPALVKTLDALASPPSRCTGIVIAMKVRHPSEAVFFGLMAEAGMEQTGCFSVPLPSIMPDMSSTVDIHIFRKPFPC
ncbi:MAG: Mitochondrial presequence protease [Watsoniomyces obsoletus]|nr:MAG: Mitochondrial presequence protease [Watsoniomyces obsoletus]